MGGMATIAYPLIVAIVGALAFCFSKHPKIVRIGEVLLFAGVLWTVYALMGRQLHF